MFNKVNHFPNLAERIRITLGDDRISDAAKQAVQTPLEISFVDIPDLNWILPEEYRNELSIDGLVTVCAAPHRDSTLYGDSLFLNVVLHGLHTFSSIEHHNGEDVRIDTGDTFVVDPASMHWATPVVINDVWNELSPLVIITVNVDKNKDAEQVINNIYKYWNECEQG